MSSNRPNILVIMSDTHATWATGCYGSEIALTPNIDRLAAEGICFDRAYSHNPICVPCRQSLVTGQYSFQCGVLQNDTPMPELYTMAHHLGKAGYDTAALGKMHFIPDTESSLGQERHHGFTDRIDYEEFWHYLRNERGCPPVEGHPDDPWQNMAKLICERISEDSKDIRLANPDALDKAEYLRVLTLRKV